MGLLKYETQLTAIEDCGPTRLDLEVLQVRELYRSVSYTFVGLLLLD